MIFANSETNSITKNLHNYPKKLQKPHKQCKKRKVTILEQEISTLKSGNKDLMEKVGQKLIQNEKLSQEIQYLKRQLEQQKQLRNIKRMRKIDDAKVKNNKQKKDEKELTEKGNKKFEEKKEKEGMLKRTVAQMLVGMVLLSGAIRANEGKPLSGEFINKHFETNFSHSNPQDEKLADDDGAPDDDPDAIGAQKQDSTNSENVNNINSNSPVQVNSNLPVQNSTKTVFVPNNPSLFISVKPCKENSEFRLCMYNTNAENRGTPRESFDQSNPQHRED
ncbi:hypothetical protein M0811_10692 [Anaeramoeba ignava]|uniref:Uncharacterized protein n=1 Tax=Anaeramoeba ignava TaxID=1746090 RepID=A0A9Q0LD08_ANAIG|nr:hypothetical protein M0811_10692 [Anaeramoeba ignava]|eukprot:Anaeramoba_ignava/a228792_96.p1 GENE.a228792_96~~a228792_96.p1  ORF type:complete len:302 (+),score=105.18 a228792_96:77-907(+)